eukprot:1177267-Rhodomonas_salina.3
MEASFPGGMASCTGAADSLVCVAGRMCVCGTWYLMHCTVWYQSATSTYNNSVYTTNTNYTRVESGHTSLRLSTSSVLAFACGPTVSRALPWYKKCAQSPSTLAAQLCLGLTRAVPQIDRTGTGGHPTPGAPPSAGTLQSFRWVPGSVPCFKTALSLFKQDRSAVQPEPLTPRVRVPERAGSNAGSAFPPRVSSFGANSNAG